MTISRRLFCASALPMAASLGATPLMAQSNALGGFPNRTVRIVVPFPAGGNSDIISRAIANRLTQTWGHPVLVDNKPGADTVIATSEVARAAPDGYTILSNISLIVQNTFTKKLPFDTFKELKPLIAATETPMFFVASQAGDFQPKNLAQFLQRAKQKPGTTSFGSFGNGSTGHLLLLALRRNASVDITHVPFKGNSDVIIQLLNGQVSSSFLPYSAIAAHLGSGRIRILAATGQTRPSFAPETPTFEELGISGFSASQWNGFFISARTPPAIQAKLVRDFDAAIKSKDVASKLESLGLTPVGGTSERLQKMLTQDTELIRSAIESGQFRAE